MMKIFLILIIIFSISSLSAQDKRTFQFWNVNSVQGSISKKTRIRINEKIHYTPNQTNLDLFFADVFVIHRPYKKFELGSGFRMSKTDKEFGWLKEQRYMAFGKIFNESEKFEFTFVNRFEYRNFDLDKDHFRHKQSFTLLFPQMTNWELRFYSTEETFIKFNNDNLHLSRLYAGLQASGLKYLTMKFYYILEKYKQINNWNTRDVLGLNMSFYL